jgi:arginase
MTADVLPAGPVVVHIDLDVIDSAELPGLRFPAPGGPPTASVLAAVQRVLDSGRVVALDIACPWHVGGKDDAEIRRRLLATLAALR